MRHLLSVLALSLLATQVTAQTRITPNTCVDPGDAITVSDRAIPRQQSGDVFVQVGNRRLELTVTNWREGRFKARMPRSGLTEGTRYPLVWLPVGAGVVNIGSIEICADSGSVKPGRQGRAPKDVIPTPSGAPEYVVIVPNAQINAATGAVTAIGGTVLRARTLGQFGQTILMVELSGGAGLQDLRDALNGPAPGATADLHHVYGFAQGARLYAGKMVGASDRGCSAPSGTRIGLIDSGVNSGHPALHGVPVRNFNALADGEKRLAPNHGTAVAALIAGSTDNLGGFAQGANIFAAEAFGASKTRSGARLENIAVSLDWLAGQRVKYVNLSMSGAPNQTFARLLQLSASKGAVLVAAAGNEGTTKPRFPAASSHTIAVTAVDASGKAYRKANGGQHIDIAAPGVDLYVAGSSGGGYKSGTSYAAPIVTARLAAARVGSTKQAESFLAKNSSDLGASGRDTKFGHGLIHFSNCF